MVKIARNKLARGLVAAALGAGALSLSLPAEAHGGAHFGGHFAGHRGHYGHAWGGSHVSIGIGVGSCCWGPAWGSYSYYGYYYPYPYPYIARPARLYDYDDYADYASGGVSLRSPWVQKALGAPVGDAVEWNDGAVHGSVTTTRDGWSGARYCREFRQSITVDGGTRDAYGTACRTPDDRGWQLVPNQ